jgi:archaellum component FlaC
MQLASEASQATIADLSTKVDQVTSSMMRLKQEHSRSLETIEEHRNLISNLKTSLSAALDK